MPPTSPIIPLLLAALSAIGPFAIDAYLPAFAAIAASLGATQLEVQQTLTAYLLALAGMVLWHGALADRYGRRVVLMVSSAVFALASALCALAPSIEWLWAGRVLQGLVGGAGTVVGRAVIRDLHEGAQARRQMSHVMLIFALAPAVAPLIGAALLELGGWRVIFVFLTAFGVLLFWLCWRYLPETLPADARQPLHPVGLARAYGGVLKNATFILIALAVSLNFGGFFLYVLSAPVFVMTHLGLGTGGFGWFFIPAVSGLMAGSMVSGIVAERWTPRRTIAVGFVLMIVAAVSNLAIAALLPPGLPWSIVAIPVYTFGMSLVMPSLSLKGLDLYPTRRGMASSCQSFLQIGMNAVLAGVIAPAIWSTTLTLAAGMCVYLSLSIIMAQALEHRRKSRG